MDRRLLIEKVIFSDVPEELRKKVRPLRARECRPKQLQNLMSILSETCTPEDIVAVVDRTTLQTGKYGMMFAKNGIYAMMERMSGYYPTFLSYGEIESMELWGKKPDTLYLTYYYRKEWFCKIYGEEKYLRFLYAALIGIVEAIAEDEAGQGTAQKKYDCACMYDTGKYSPINKEKAFYWFEKAGEQGNTEARFQCGQRCSQGIGTAVDMEKAAKWYERAAQDGHCEAQFRYGEICQLRGTVEDKKEALSWYGEAADQGHEEALDRWEDLDYELDAIKLAELEKLASSGDMEAQYACARMYQEGEGTEEDSQKAFFWYGRAAEQGHTEAQYQYGEMYEEGTGGEQDLAKALYWYEKAAAQDHLLSIINCGIMYSEGNGTAVDLTKALYWCERGAKRHSNPTLQSICASFYDKGLGTEKDQAKALYWYEQAAKQGELSSQLQCAWRYSHGQGVKENKERAFYWYEQAAKQGDAKAQFNLGLCYSKGIGTENDEGKAFYWYEQAAKQGDAKAQYNCGRRYQRGVGTKKDADKAIYWLQKAAGQGHEKAAAECKRWCDEAYREGSKIHLRKKKSKFSTEFEQLEIAAKLGHAQAQYEVAEILYHNGYDILDVSDAKDWYKKAAAQGNIEAYMKLGDLYFEKSGQYLKALSMYEKVVELDEDNEAARFNCGLMNGLMEEYETALEWLLPLARRENREAQYNCSVIYKALGDGYESKYWRQRAAEKGRLDAENLIQIKRVDDPDADW